MRPTVVVLALALAVAACSGAGANLTPASLALLPHHSSGSTPIQHVVIIVQENRSFDDFFDCFKGTECVKRGKEKVKEGSQYVDKWVTLKKEDLVATGKYFTDIGHCYSSFYFAYDGGKMDGFNLEPTGACPRSWGPGKSNVIAYQYTNPADIAPYWDMAQQYALADRTFQTQGSGSFTAHQDLIRGATVVDTSGDSLIDTPTGDPWGCDSINPYTVTDLVTPALKWELDKGPFPCSDKFGIGSSSYETLADLMDAAGVGWRYYSPCYSGSPTSGGCNDDCNTCAGALLNAFDVIYHVRYGPEWGTNVVMPQTQILADVANGGLQNVSWVIPSQNDSDHPGVKPDDGPSWVASVVNAIGESSYWSSTAIVVVWDDWGGLYDHVAPPGERDQQGGPGFRVPMIVISPYIPAGEVSHTRYSFGSILRYIEDNWNLGSLGTTDQSSNSIVNMFDYQQQPRTFTTIPSSKSIEYFKREPPSSAPADTE